jgi:hypothetical protein
MFSQRKYLTNVLLRLYPHCEVTIAVPEAGYLVRKRNVFSSQFWSPRAWHQSLPVESLKVGKLTVEKQKGEREAGITVRGTEGKCQASFLPSHCQGNQPNPMTARTHSH